MVVNLVTVTLEISVEPFILFESINLRFRLGCIPNEELWVFEDFYGKNNRRHRMSYKESKQFGWTCKKIGLPTGPIKKTFLFLKVEKNVW